MAKVSTLLAYIKKKIDEIKNSKKKMPTDKYRILAYKNVADKITESCNVNGNITAEDINHLDLTDSMKAKLISKIGNKTKSGKLLSEKPKADPKADRKLTGMTSDKHSDKQAEVKLVKSRVDTDKLYYDLVNFMGIGDVKAKQLIKEGLTHINQLHMDKWFKKLPSDTQAYLQYKPLKKIPHEEIKKIAPQITSCTDDSMEVIITGSYRRGKPYSRDIDVMVVSDESGIMDKFLHKLKKHFDVFPYAKGTDKMSLIIIPRDVINPKLALNASYASNFATHGSTKSANLDDTSVPTITYKMDVFQTPKKYKYSMLLYSTGSKKFNIRMRGKAKKMGYLLNQTGLYRRDGKSPLILTSEKEYFDKLDMEYLTPEQRSEE